MGPLAIRARPITDEILLGYATPIAERYSFDMFFISRTMNNFIEDVPSRMSGTAPDSGPFVAANLPCARFVACQAADARRTYRAFTVDLRRRLARGWMGDISYTWSRFEGNFDLDYSTVAVFNTSSFIQDGPGTNVEDPNRFGPLFEDRPHVFKMFSSYAVTTRLDVSGYLRVQSGTPWAARGRDWEGGVLNYLEPAGTHRNPSWANLDLMGAYRLPLEDASVTLEAPAECFQQSDATLHRFSEVSGSSDRSDAAILRVLPAGEPVLRNRQRLRATAPRPPRRSRQVLGYSVFKSV
jgi:hypothetical protein